MTVMLFAAGNVHVVCRSIAMVNEPVSVAIQLQSLMTNVLMQPPQNIFICINCPSRGNKFLVNIHLM